MFDEFGNPIPIGGKAPLTFPAMQGYGSTPVNLPYMDLMNAPPRSMGSIMTGMPSPVNGPLASMTTPGASGPTSMWDSFLGKPGQQGWGSLALGAANGLMGGYIGLQQLGIAKDTLNQNKRQFDLNFGAQQKMTNSRLSDRQATRVASGLTNVGVQDYMKQYGI